MTRLDIPVLARLRPIALHDSPVPSKLIFSPDSLCLGRPSAKYKLVMFGDYECPPCRAEWPRIVRFADEHKDALAVYFRNYPLTSIHPQAIRAATAAEVAKAGGRFAAAHNALFTNALPEKSYQRFFQSLGILPKAVDAAEGDALKRVMADLNLAIGLGLSGTPTFFLIDGSNAVYSVQSLDELRSFIG